MQKKLQNVYEKWQVEKLVPFTEDDNADFSKPFYIGISSEFDPKKKTVLIYGQEANNFGKYQEEWTVRGIQEWCREYIDIQFKNKKGEGYNLSPFWKFFRGFNSIGLNVVWGNIDRIHKYEGENTKSLSAEDELNLNGRFGEMDTTLLEMEIDIIRPDIVVFVIGPHYFKSLGASLNIDNKILRKIRPTKCSSLADITELTNRNEKTFWTYHPKYQNIIKKMDENIEYIFNAID